ncbi:hypothetical protein DM02DRAFT_282143 [Periconia macrospinosa]|uniref:Fungal N-terminal domain-containing protein n=1 Tax=Periconia macrospinosa TaxID=97972 RepID=A0A2V1D2U7_9PLEO|nr:hypothetical protein DM02DRAFT_282143 [Periconia macrospinosa]
MATGLQIFSLACNIMQTIQSARNTIDLCIKMQEEDSVAPEIQVQSAELAQVTQSLQQSLHEAKQNRLEKYDKRMEKMAAELLNVAAKARKELAKYGKIASGSRKNSVLKTVKYWYRASNIVDMRTVLSAFQRAMEKRVLVKLRYVSKDRLYEHVLT